MGNEFPDWREYAEKSQFEGIRGWMALGFAWLKQNTKGLLPWIALLPPTDYLPLCWTENERKKHLFGTIALQKIKSAQKELDETRQYLAILGVSFEEVRNAFAMISSRAFGTNVEEFGGSKSSLIIPCGVDFANH